MLSDGPAIRFDTDRIEMSAVAPEQIDQSEVSSMESRMLSYYACARELYLSRSYRAPEAIERLAAHPEKD